MTSNNDGGQPGSTRPLSPLASRRTRQGLSVGGVIAAIALSFYLLNGGVATSQDSGGTPDASPVASLVASPQADDPRITIDFTELNDSGVTGTATLYASGAMTIVEIDLEGTGEDHPAHIHTGTCDDIQPEPAYNLQNVGEEGSSTSVVDAPLGELIDGDYVIDLHLAANQLGTLIVCADIEGEPANAGGTPVAIGGQVDPTASATAPDAATTEPTVTQGPTAAPTVAPTQTPAPTLEPTATLPPSPEPTTPPESTPDESSDSVGGLISVITPADGDGTQGSSSMLDSGKGAQGGNGGNGGAVTTASGKGGSTTGTGDGTQGGSDTQSGKGGTVLTTTTSLPASAGSGSSLVFPQTPYEAAITASGAFSVILFGAAMMLRRGEIRTAPSRWRRIGL